jgi:hypothetical protein
VSCLLVCTHERLPPTSCVRFLYMKSAYAMNSSPTGATMAPESYTRGAGGRG